MQPGVNHAITVLVSESIPYESEPVAIKSFKEFDHRPVGPGDIEIGECDILWGQQPGFGPYLRRAREEKGLSLRKAARGLGVSHTYLLKLEAGERAGSPDREFIDKVAALYECNWGDVMHEAGYRIDLPDDMDPGRRLNEAFARMVLDPRVQPLGLSTSDLDLLAPKVKAKWIAFARMLAEMDDPEVFLDDVLSSREEE